MASFLRIDPGNGSIEVGRINYSPLLQRTPAATEAMFQEIVREMRSETMRFRADLTYLPKKE